MSRPAPDFRIRLRPENRDKLIALAEDAELPASVLASRLLEELLPTVKSVRQRLQIVREGQS